MSAVAFQVPLMQWSPKAAVLLQLCRDGKCEHYGVQLSDLTLYDTKRDFIFDVQGASEMIGEIEAYREVALQYRIRTALDRWRKTADEADAEIVLNGRSWLEQKLSHAELHAICYDAAAKQARDMLDRMSGLDDAGKLGDLLHELFLLTADIPAETGRPFPYDRVLLGWPGGSTEDAVMAHVQTYVMRLISLYREGRCESWERLSDSPGVKRESMFVSIKMRMNEWGFSYDQLELEPDEIAELEQLLPGWRELMELGD